jgi:hypothetical protein
MTLDEVNNLRTRANAIYNALEEFCALFRKKHEKWTYEAFEQALSDLDDLHNDVLDRLYDTEEVKKELGPDPLTNIQDHTMAPRRSQG